MSAKAKILYFQEPLFEEFKKDICYVCNKWIKKDTGLNVGKGVWRHTRCKPIDPKLTRNSSAGHQVNNSIMYDHDKKTF